MVEALMLLAACQQRIAPNWGPRLTNMQRAMDDLEIPKASFSHSPCQR